MTSVPSCDSASEYIWHLSSSKCSSDIWVRNDLALARSFRPLGRIIPAKGEEAGLKASVKYWGGAWEVEQVFKTL